MKVEKNKDNPHRVVFVIDVSIHELSPTGECSGHSVVGTKTVKYIDGENAKDAENKMWGLLEEINNLCQK